MGKLFFRFFQVVCLLQLSAFGQLNAHPNMESATTSLITSLNELQPQNLVVQDQLDEKISLSPAPPGYIVSVDFESLDEKDYEPAVSKKSLISKDYFTQDFDTQLAVYLSHNDENHLVFSRQTPLVPANRRHVILQVFRI